MEKYKVELYIYDLSMGMAKTLAQMFIGRPLEGIWHTSIVVFGREYLFNSNGVENCIPASTHLGKPLRVEVLGYTEVPYQVFLEYLNSISESTYTGSTYNLFTHNCNNFSEEIAQFLVGKSIPQYILDLPKEVLNSNLSPPLLALLNQLEKGAHVGATGQSTKEGSPDYQELQSQIEEARYHSLLLELRRKRLTEKFFKREKKKAKERERRRREGEGGTQDEENTMSEAELVNGNNKVASPTAEQLLALDEEERLEEEEQKIDKNPPIVFSDAVDVKAEFDALINLIDGKISTVEQGCMEELSVYMLEGEGCWALSDNFLTFVGRVFNDAVFPVEARVRMTNILAAGALKSDIILLLHQDRKDHVLMNYAFGIDRLSLEEQQALSLLICNLFSNMSASEWLLYISEWNLNGQQTSNLRVTTKVSVHCLLADDKVLQDRGTAIIHNLGCKEVKTVVFDDVAVELAMAVLQFFNSKPSEEHLFRCMKALAKFSQVSRQEVPQLIQMIGPDPKSFAGTSERVDQQIAEIGTGRRS
ncbi:uncharacterized protein LOC123317322 isoform X2 [Coccinella septempunctata]|uniref:uncharacterized protein LOC123317322 isoform X2 n=1 Tax=Coccinella septempunctata TaxID=41139 RepID=UPI001D08147C|nr:uncharacterized protein LOC123317322 isoform X2 [Coccinella septempunctata]